MFMRAACQLIHVLSPSRLNISAHRNGKIWMTARVRGGGTVSALFSTCATGTCKEV